MSIYLAILLAIIIVFVFKAIVFVIEYAQLGNSLFYVVIVIAVTLFILILTAKPGTFN